MHRDIKPENFLLTDKSDQAIIKAADFGLCTYFKPGERFKQLVGSAYYVAPEVLRKNYSCEADMWSLGVVLYILLCGLPPFWGNTGELSCTATQDRLKAWLLCDDNRTSQIPGTQAVRSTPAAYAHTGRQALCDISTVLVSEQDSHVPHFQIMLKSVYSSQQSLADVYDLNSCRLADGNPVTV